MRISSRRACAAATAICVVFGTRNVAWGQSGQPIQDETLRQLLTNNADDAKALAESSTLLGVSRAAWERRYALLRAILAMHGSRPALLWRDLGEAAERTGRLLEALDAYEECRGLLASTDPLADICESLARRVRTGQLATLRLTVPSSPTGLELLVGDKRLGEGHWSDPIALLPGPVSVVALAPGFDRFSQQLTVVAGSEYSLDVSLRALPQPAPEKPAQEPGLAPAAPASASAEQPLVVQERGWGGLLGLVSVGFGPAWGSFPSTRFTRSGGGTQAYTREDVSCTDSDPCTTAGREGWAPVLSGMVTLMTIGAASEWIEVGARGLFIGLPTGGDFGGGGMGGPWFLGRLGRGPAWLGFGAVAGALSMPFSIEGGQATAVANTQGWGVVVPRDDDSVWGSTGLAVGMTSELRFCLTPDDSAPRLDLFVLPTVLRGDGSVVVLVPVALELLLDTRRDPNMASPP